MEGFSGELESKMSEALDLYRQYKEATFFPTYGGRMDTSEPVWLFDRPYRWIRRPGIPLTLVPDYWIRATKHYQIALLVGNRKLCELCGEYK